LNDGAESMTPSRALQKAHDYQSDSGTERGTTDPPRQGTSLFNARLEVAELERVFPMSKRRRSNDEPEPNEDEHHSGDSEIAHANSVVVRIGVKPTGSRGARRGVASARPAHPTVKALANP